MLTVLVLRFVLFWILHPDFVGTDAARRGQEGLAQGERVRDKHED